jgi:hypothetical protein
VEGVSGAFSDPFTLSGEPNPLIALDGVVLTPVPEPQVATMLLVGLLVLTGCAYYRRRRTGRIGLTEASVSL